MTVSQTAARWGVTVSLVRRWCRDGRIPGARLRDVEGQPRPVWEIPADAQRPHSQRSRPAT